MDKPAPNSVRGLDEAILSLVLAMAALVPIAIWNRYIFSESNLPFLLILLLLVALIFGPGKVPKDIKFPGIAISFLLFILYAWARLDHGWDFEVTAVNPDGTRPGFLYVVDLAVFYLLFVIAAALFYRYMQLSAFLWFLICGYILAFIIRNSFNIGGLQEGYNLSPGFALIALLPFVFLMHTSENKVPVIPSVILFLCIIWLALIGARTAVIALSIFYIVLWVWPLITRNRFTYYSIFWGTLLFIALLTVVYFLYAISNPADALLEESLVEETGVGFFQKRIGTRIGIWSHLLYLISQQPIFGYGTDHTTFGASPIPFLDFTLKRDNLSAHSTYFELLYRLGAVGLLGFILIMFSIWRLYWSAREQWAVRVAGAFLLCALFFASTGEYFAFSTLQLRSGFGWIILGIGAGASLRAMKNARSRSQVVLKSGAMHTNRPVNNGLAVSKRY